jgi:hypothetical protein
MQLLTKRKYETMDMPKDPKSVKDIHATHINSNKKVYFRVVDNFLDPEYTTLKQFFVHDTIIRDGETFLCGAAHVEGFWVIGLLNSVNVFSPL